MFKNIGKKIKILAKALCWLGIIIFIILGAILMITSIATNNAATLPLFFEGLAFLIAGPITAWLGNLLLYGFGELIDKTSAIAEKLGCEEE